MDQQLIIIQTPCCILSLSQPIKKKKKTMIEYVRLKKFQLTFCGIFFINVTKLCTCFQVQWNLTIYVIIPLKVRIPVVNLL